MGEGGRVQEKMSESRGQRSGKAPKGRRWGIVDAHAGRIGSEGNGTASALGERSYRTAE